MKIRNGFVSNSSSSSFIIGIGVIKDEEKVKSIMQNVADYAYHIETVKKINDKFLSDHDNEKFTVGSFNYDSVSVDHKGLKDDEKILHIYYGTGDDSDFMICDDNDEFIEYDYDIDESFFEGDEAYEAIKELENSDAIKQFEWAYGAGRNG